MCGGSSLRALAKTTLAPLTDFARGDEDKERDLPRRSVVAQRSGARQAARRTIFIPDTRDFRVWSVQNLGGFGFSVPISVQRGHFDLCNEAHFDLVCNAWGACIHHTKIVSCFYSSGASNELNSSCFGTACCLLACAFFVFVGGGGGRDCQGCQTLI